MTIETNAERLEHIQYQIDDARLHGGMYSSTHVELEWLIQQAETAARLSAVEDANYRFYNNGFEEERWALQEENIRLRKALQNACNSLGADVEDYLPEGESE